MMKFKGQWDQFPQPDRVKEGHNEFFPYAFRIPTVDEVNDTLSFMYADTVLQILKGQGIYRGYDCERHCDNDIQNYPLTKDLTEQRQQWQREYYHRKVKARKQTWQYKFDGLRPSLKVAIRKIAKARKTDLESAVKLMLPLLEND